MFRVCQRRGTNRPRRDIYGRRPQGNRAGSFEMMRHLLSHQDRDRDLTIDRLLAATMTRMSHERGASCLEAETIAAWADGALTKDEIAAAQAHAADCAHCQAIVGALSK